MKWLSPVLFFSIVVALLGSTSWSNDRIAADGYVFKGKQFTNYDVRVRMVYYADITELQLEANIRKFTNSEQLLAFAISQENYCEIHTVDPMHEYSPERYGHELMHCVHGNWHDRQFVITYED